MVLLKRQRKQVNINVGKITNTSIKYSSTSRVDYIRKCQCSDYKYQYMRIPIFPNIVKTIKFKDILLKTETNDYNKGRNFKNKT